MIKLAFRKVLYVFLSVIIILAPTINFANAASGWSITGVTSAGARAVVSATKGGYKSAVNVAPSAGRLALKLGKGANWAALLYAAISLAPDLADIKSFQPDYANNRLKYNISKIDIERMEGYCRANAGSDPNRQNSTVVAADRPGYGMTHYCQTSDGHKWAMIPYNLAKPVAKEQYLPIGDVAPSVLANAANGHAASQEAVRQAAAEMVATGDFDKDLLSGAVPINDSRPVIPAVPGSQNGNTAPGDNTSGATPGEQSQAANAAEAAKKSAQAAAEAAKAAAEEARRAADEAKDLINQAVDQAIKDAAQAAADVAEKAAKDAKDVAEAAAEKAAEAAKEAVRQAEKERDIARDKTKEAEEALKKAKEEGTKTQEEIGELERALEKAKEEATKAKERADEAAKEAEKAKAEAAKPFELPAFCSWATPVCDYMNWVKTEYGTMKEFIKQEAVPLPDENIEIQETMPDGWIDKANAGYVSFDTQCPADVQIPLNYMGASHTLNLSYIPFCSFATLIRPAVILGAWISGLLIISGGRSRE